MDGNDWYTTAVLTTMTLGITMLYFERGFLVDRNTGVIGGGSLDLSMTNLRIMRFSILLAFALFIALLSWLLLIPNLHDLKMDRHALLNAKKWIALSTLGVTITNCGAFLNGWEAQAAFEWDWDHGEFVSLGAHYLLMVSFFMAMVATDMLFLIKVLHPFLHAITMPSVNQSNGYEYRIHRDVLAGFDASEWREATCLRKAWVALKLMSIVARDIMVHFVVGLLTACYRYIWNPASIILHWMSKPVWFVLWQCVGVSCCQCLSKWYSQTTGAAGEVSASVDAHLTSYIQNNENLGEGRSSHHDHQRSCTVMIAATSSCLGTAMARFVLKAKRKIKEGVIQMWESMKEEGGFKHSSWVKASVLTSAILLLYFGLRLLAIYQGAFKDMYKEHRDCALRNPKLADFFLRSAGFGLTSPVANVNGNLTVPGMAEGSIDNVTDGDIVRELQTLLGGGRDSEDIGDIECLNIQDRQTQVLVAAVVSFERSRAAVEDMSPSDRFAGKTIGEAAIVMDRILHRLRWPIWLGFAVGLLYGVWSLFTIFDQYKRVATSLRTGSFDDLPAELRGKLDFGPREQNSTGQDQDRRWNRLLKVYQLSRMVLVTGMLVSTAIVQLVVAGAIVALVLALLISLYEVPQILSPVAVFLLSLLFAWMVNSLIAPILAEKLLLDGYVIRHEHSFLLFALVFTMTQLVLGVPLAIFRLLSMLLTTMLKINRLDINLFLTWQSCDVGHKSFIALVLLNHVNELSRVCKRRPPAPMNDIVVEVDASGHADASKYPAVRGNRAASNQDRDHDATHRPRDVTGAQGAMSHVPLERVNTTHCGSHPSLRGHAGLSGSFAHDGNNNPSDLPQI